jgi:hypothetical protein
MDDPVDRAMAIIAPTGRFSMTIHHRGGDHAAATSAAPLATGASDESQSTEPISPILTFRTLAGLGARDEMLLDGGDSSAMAIGAGASEVSPGVVYGGSRPVAMQFGGFDSLIRRASPKRSVCCAACCPAPSCWQPCRHWPQVLPRMPSAPAAPGCCATLAAQGRLRNGPVLTGP